MDLQKFILRMRVLECGRIIQFILINYLFVNTLLLKFFLCLYTCAEICFIFTTLCDTFRYKKRKKKETRNYLLLSRLLYNIFYWLLVKWLVIYSLMDNKMNIYFIRFGIVCFSSFLLKVSGYCVFI